MKRLLLHIILLTAALSVQAQVTMTRADSLTLAKVLKEMPRNASALWAARRFLGVPYVAHTLEVNDQELLVVNTRQLDCLTLVETATALAICTHENKRSVADYQHVLCRLRYRQGTMNGYASRLHYFSDWIADNELMGIVEEVQSSEPPFTAVQTLNVHFMSRHPDAYKALKADPGLVPDIRKQEEALNGRSVRYIPKEQVRNHQLLQRYVSDGDIIAITCNKPGLDIAHVGLAVWKKGRLHLLNASQLHKKVVEEPMTLYRYLQKHPTFTGIRVVRIVNR